MGDGVLARDYTSIFQSSGDVMAEVRVDRGYNVDILRHPRNRTEEINCAFETPRKQPSASQEQIPYTGGLEVEHGGWTSPFYDLEVYGVEE